MPLEICAKAIMINQKIFPQRFSHINKLLHYLDAGSAVISGIGLLERCVARV